MADGQKTTTNTHNGFNLNVSAAVDYCPNYPPMHNKGPRSKKASGSSACDPVTVLDDDEPDTAEINYIDLETDGGALTEENCTASIKHSVAGTHGTGVSKVVKTNSPYNTTQGPDLAGRTKRNVSLLFRPLTTDDSSAPSVQAVPEKRGIGFKAWYSKIDPFLTVRPVREMQQKQVSKNPSIALINKERTQSMTTRNRDAPQLDMNVLESKRKRTMGELGYNELISPAQIESPSEKLARLTKKRRKRQERCDLLLQITNAGDAAINERKTASASSASVPVPIQTTPTHVPIDIQIVTPAPLAKTRATPLDSDTRAPTVADLSGSRPTIKDHTSSSSHLGSKLDQLESLVEHRATAGKGLSQETLRRFQKTGSWNCGMEMDQNAVEVEAEETEVPNIAYHYFVRKREWLETEEDAIESSLGPFLTMNEANAVAKAEVQSPQVDGYEEIQPSGWSYYYEQDEYGMQMHMATVLEIHIETAVHRTLVPANKRVSIPKSAFIVAPRVFIVHEVQWPPSSPDVTITAPSHRQLLTHGAYTMLNQANRRASAEFLETLTGNWGDSEYDLLKKVEMKSDLDKKVRVLKRENDCFCEVIKLDNDQFVKVWVELVVVEGPRN